MQKILLVEDEPAITETLTEFLTAEGFGVTSVSGQSGAEMRLRSGKYDLLLVDVSLAEGDGFGVCRAAKSEELPVIFLTASGDETSVVRGLDMGADDYIPKPFSPREMVARVKAVFRRIDGMRSDSAAALTPYCRDLKIYPDERRVVKVTENGEEDLNFTAMEYNFINFMIANKNRVFTRDQLLTNIWEYQYIGDTRAVDDLVKRIRKKLDSHHTDFSIETVWGYGYKVTDSVD